MRRRAVVGLALLLGGVAPPHAAAEWSYLGLGNRWVTALELQDGVLYAGTDAGLHTRQVDAADTLWTSHGLENRWLLGVLALDARRWFAGARLAAVPDTVSLFRTVDGGANWIPSQNGFGGAAAAEVRSLLAFPGSDRHLLGAGWGGAKSEDGGGSWRTGIPKVLLNFIALDPRVPARAWAGGESFIFAPVMLRSDDAGDTWEPFQLEAGGDNACDAIAFHPADANVVYVGMEGRVMRTLDAGMTWHEVTSPNPALYLFGMAIPNRLPLRIYAAGTNSPPRPLAVYASDDGGATWTTITHPTSIQFGVSALLLVTDGTTDTLFLGTQRGVYRYRHIVSPVDRRSWTDLKRVFR